MLVSSDVIDRVLEIKKFKTDAKLAEYLEVAASTLTSWRTRNSIPFEKIIAFCKYEKISMDYIFTGEGKKHIEGQADGEEGMEQPLNLELDVDLLADIIESIDIVLEKEKIELPLNKKARFIALQYELCTETGKGVTSDKIKRHLKLVA